MHLGVNRLWSEVVLWGFRTVGAVVRNLAHTHTVVTRVVFAVLGFARVGRPCTSEVWYLSAYWHDDHDVTNAITHCTTIPFTLVAELSALGSPASRWIG